MMNCDYEYFRGADIAYPTKPTKPRLSIFASAAEARTYADELTQYEIELATFKEKTREYQAARDSRLAEFKNMLKSDYDLSMQQFDILWDNAYEDGHSGGLQEIHSHFHRYYDMCTKFAY